MADENSTGGRAEGTVTTLKRFVRICLKRGQTLEQARDALLVANLDRNLVERTLEAALFDNTKSVRIPTDISLDHSKAKTVIPNQVQTRQVRARPSQIRNLKKLESVELNPTPFYSPHSDGLLLSRKIRVRGISPMGLHRQLLHWTLRWIFAGAAVFGLLFFSHGFDAKVFSSHETAMRAISGGHSRLEYRPDRPTQHPSFKKYSTHTHSQ